MTPSMLLTSFDVWKDHHTSNASDDLLVKLLQRQLLSPSIRLLRKVPVDFDVAPVHVINHMEQWQPDVVVCCGMAEKRSHLSVESNGTLDNHTIHTPVNVDELVQGLSCTYVSHDAGWFVCNYTYYSILQYIKHAKLKTKCIFVHVPVLTAANQNAIVTDFATILMRLAGTSHHMIRDRTPSCATSTLLSSE